METINLGNKECNWFIPKDFLTKNSIVYCFGAGENISFEVDLANLYTCRVNIFDPTPRASAFFHNRHQHYQIINNDCLNFFCMGLSDRSGEYKFYLPKNKEYVSHSLEPISGDFIMANFKTLSRIMWYLDDTEIDLLKIDIEGTEYKVLKQIIESDLEVKCIAVEFHNGIIDLPGYETIKTDGNNVTFLKL